MSTNDTNNPMLGMFSGMLNQFFREAIASGNLSAIMSGASASADTAGQTTASIPVPTLAVPPAIPYTSTRRSVALPPAATGHPQPSSIPSSLVATQPMLGISGLGLSLAGHSNSPRRSIRDLDTAQVSQTNSTRRAAAHAHLGPAGATLQLRQRRRGSAVRPPVLHPGPQTTLDKVSSLNPEGVREVRINHLVQAYQEVVGYKNFKAAQQQYLQDAGLLFQYSLPVDTRVHQILEMSADNMRTGPRRYTFVGIPTGPSTRLRHESLDLQVLVYVNLGKNRGDGASHLRRESVAADLTLKDLFSPDYKNTFAIAAHCIDNGRFILHSIVRYGGITFRETPADGWPRIHSCLTLRQNIQFNENIEMSFTDSDYSDTSHGIPESQSESDDDDEDMPEAPTLAAVTRPTNRPLPRRTQAPASSAGTSSASSLPAPSNRPLPRRTRAPVSSASISSAGALPAPSIPTVPISVAPQIVTQTPTTLAWPTSTFIPEPGPYGDLFDRPDVSAAVYQTAGDEGSLDFEAGSIDDLALLFVQAVRSASLNGDFSRMLRQHRRFRVLKPDGTISSFGSGVERETIVTALNLFLNNPARWGLPADEDRLSLAISMPLRLASTVSPGRLQELRVFGALIALSLISSKPAGVMSPALFQYALNRCNLDALTPSFVASWHPGLERAVRELQAIGPDGNLELFRELIISKLNVQVHNLFNFLTLVITSSHLAQPATLSYRDQNQHNMLVTQMVHTSILGPDLHGHPETEAFCSGLELSCANGFSFAKLARSYPGGTEFYLAHVWTSFISTFQSLKPHLLVTVPTSTKVVQHFGAASSSLNPEAIFHGFLQRTGIPCPVALLESAKAHFHPDVVGQLCDIYSPAFRPRMLCWASTGSPFLDPDAGQTESIQIDFVLPGDLNYCDDAAASTVHMQQGTISFRSCSQVTRIPMSKLVELHQIIYPTPDIATFDAAVDTWFLFQVLNVLLILVVLSRLSAAMGDPLS
ncbi:hypothetical protein GGX14DRAFT_572373 [Mycena pura]|uniref:Uncharacterized protein n=1 Tax=Mycena pura TaxID=153505 RepID=A0AAD6Y583_9AGAR|nr:hypothetical protein GGX14DRAFT_572373 [Mycena pura]